MFCRDEYPRLVRLLSLYCGDVGAAEDLAQETLARVWRNWRRVGTIGVAAFVGPPSRPQPGGVVVPAPTDRRTGHGTRVRALDAATRRTRARIG